MKTRRDISALALFTCFVLICSPGKAYDREITSEDNNPYLHKNWTTENGLPQNSITSIVQTQDGYLWLGTFGGLVRFDGVEFTVFNAVNTPEIKSDRVRALYEDAEGSLWIGSEHGGLTRYHQGVFTNYSLRDGLPSTSVLSIAGDAGGNLWIGTLQGLALLHAGVFSRFGAETRLPRVAIEAICHDSQGNLWLGADGVGLIRYAAGAVTTYAAKNGVHSDVLAIHEGQQNTLWVGTRTGLISFDEAKFIAGSLPKIRPIGVVRAIYEGAPGIVWVASDRGLFRFSDGVKTRFATSDGLSALNLRSVFIDREQNLWIGTDGGGLNRWRRGNVRAYTATQGFTDHPTMAILQDHHGVIWIGSLSGHALFSYKHSQFFPYPHQQGHIELATNLAEDHSGSLWLGDWKYGLGLLSVKQGQLKHYTIPGLLDGGARPLDVVRSLYVDSAGALWIGTDQTGLYRLKDGEFTNYRVNDGLPSNSVAFINEDRDHALWIGTPSGIGRLKNGAFVSYRTPGLSLVRTIHEDGHGALWIGTYGYGLFRFKDGKFAQITTKNGLFDDVASSILEDAHGNFWMSGNRGIFRVRQTDLNDFVEGRLKDVRCVSYGVADGMVVSETNGGGGPSGLMARDGRIWFAMIKGLVVIDPNRMNTVPPPIAIEQVKLDGATLPPDRPINIPPSNRNLEIHYTALSLSRPEQVVFKYQLIGFDSDWVDAGMRRVVYYSRLPPGRYTFRVIADNGEGVWNLNGKSIQINAPLPFWSTKWFMSLATLALIGLATLAYRLRAAHWERARVAQETFSRQLLSSQEAERQRIAAELHDSLGQSLLIIKNRAVLALRSLPDADATKEQLEEISSGASQAVEEVREISYNLRPYQLDRFGLTKALRALCLQTSRSSGIDIVADVDEIDGLFSAETESSIYRIVQEAVNNIIKHSQAERASVAAHRNSGDLHLSVQDNGKGLHAPETYVAESRPEGFGLIGIAERARMLGGTYGIESTPERGTTVTIRLPLNGRAHVS